MPDRKRKKPLVPKLRFPEFRDAGEWEVKRLGEVADVKAAGDLDATKFSTVKTENHVYPIYANSISQQGLYGYSKYPKYRKNSVTITARGTLGVAFYRDHDFVGIGRLLIVSDFNQIVPYFFQEMWNYLASLPFEDGGIPQLTAIKARQVKLIIPPQQLAEQQKIAACLSSLDELMELEAQKCEALKAHKKGLMQQLFPREGETVPRLRFPEFKDAGEWEICKLGDLLSLEYGFSLPDSRRKDGEIPVIGSNEIVGFHDEAFIDGPAIIIGRKGSVGQVNWIDRGCCPIDTTFYVQRQREDCLLMFLKLILDVAKLSERGDKGAVPGLNRNDVYTIKTALPLEAEQQKIADCLSSLDKLIELQSRKVEALKQHKKGLMQQLFPQEVI